MGNNKQFDNILNECIEHLLAGKETVEQCLQRYPEHAAELEPLLRTAVEMNRAVDVKPSPEFRSRARAQLQSVMAKSTPPKRAPVFAPRWAIAVCAVLLVFFLSGSMVLAADGTMPGNPLYTVKLWTEDVSLKLAGSEERKAELYIMFADRRVSELNYLLANNNTGSMEKVAQRLSDNYSGMNQLLMMMEPGSWDTSGSPPKMSGAFQATDRNGEESLLGASNTADSSSTVSPPLVVVASSQPAPTVIISPQTESDDTNAGLKALISYYAVTQPEKIQELLDSDAVPESVKIVLRRALWEAENGYQNALTNLDQ